MVEIKVFEVENVNIRKELKKISKYCSENPVKIINFSEFSYVKEGILITRITLFYVHKKVKPKKTLIGREVFEFEMKENSEIFNEVNNFIKESEDIDIINMLDFCFFENTKLHRRIMIYYTLKS